MFPSAELSRAGLTTDTPASLTNSTMSASVKAEHYEQIGLCGQDVFGSLLKDRILWSDIGNVGIRGIAGKLTQGGYSLGGHQGNQHLVMPQRISQNALGRRFQRYHTLKGFDLARPARV